MKTYKEFKEALVQSLKDMYPESLEVTICKENKINGDVEKLVARFHDQKIAPSISLENLYREYEHSGDIGKIAEYVAASAASVPDGLKMPMMTREEAEENIFYQMISKERNEKLLEECPFRMLEGTDLVLILRWRCGADASFVVKHGIAEAVGVSEEDLFRMADDALERTGYRLRKMSEVMSEMMGIPEEGFQDEGTGLHVLTNRENFLGAACIMGAGVMENIRKQLGGDYFILPSSIHELLIIPDDGTVIPEMLVEMVKDVNATEVAEKDILSDHVYRYGFENGLCQVM